MTFSKHSTGSSDDPTTLQPRGRRRLLGLGVPLVAAGLLAGLTPVASSAAIHPEAERAPALIGSVPAFCSLEDDPLPEPWPEFPPDPPGLLTRLGSDVSEGRQSTFSRAAVLATALPAAALALPAGVNEVTITRSETLPAFYLRDKWGSTSFQRPVLEKQTVCVGPNPGKWPKWRLVVTSATEVTKQGFAKAKFVDVTPGVVQGTNDCAVLRRMYDDLNTVARTPALGNNVKKFRYYSSAAVRAHHDVHVTHYQTGVNAALRNFTTALAGFSVVAPDAAAAKALLLRHTTHTDAFDAFNKEVSSVTEKSEGHAFEPGDYVDAELKVVTPLLTVIDGRRKAIAATTKMPC